MKLLVVVPKYPDSHDPYKLGFVHRRVIEYRKIHDCRVAVHGEKVSECGSYTYEGVPVYLVPRREFVEFVRCANPDAVLIHFCGPWVIRNLVRNIPQPKVVWVHGAEALSWYRRLFNAEFSVRFARYVAASTLQIHLLRNLVRDSDDLGVRYVFVSEWMKEMAERDVGIEFPVSSVIPNPIDTKLFRYEPKNADMRRRILVIRPFSSKKYACDIAVQGIIRLSTRECFRDMEIAIYGRGSEFGRLTGKLLRFPNVAIREQLIPQSEIPHIHRDYGVFLCPTRQDSQGVSMCEAMASGLVPVSSMCSAIPEFITDGENGLLTSSPDEIADALEYLYWNPNAFMQMSVKASATIGRMAGADIVIPREIAVIENWVRGCGLSNTIKGP